MLAALTIALAILALLAQFTRQSLHNWNRGESSIAAMEMLTSGLGRLRTDLSLALPLRAPGTDDPRVLFAGSADQLLFVAATGFGAGTRGLELISVTMTKDENGIAVVRQRGPVTTGPAPLRDPVVLLRGRMQVQFTFRDDDGKAVKTWTNQQQLPKAVVVEVLNAAGVSVFAAPVVMNLPVSLLGPCGGSNDEASGAPACTVPGTQKQPGAPSTTRTPT